MTLTMEVSFLSLFLCEEVWKLTKKEKKVCQALFLSSFLNFSSSHFSAAEEEGERGAAGGRDPGLREDSHGEEQPPEGSRQDGQRHYSVRCTVRSFSYSSFTQQPYGSLMNSYRFTHGWRGGGDYIKPETSCDRHQHRIQYMKIYYISQQESA